MPKNCLAVGSPAPDFTLPDPQGGAASLKDFRGSWLVLYFYPRDNTSGCTLEAVDFTARAGDFKKLKTQVVGISTDSPASHQKFISKHDLGITLLSDIDRRIVRLYGVWRTKKLYGKESKGVVRTTFLIDPAGVIRRIWETVKVKGHADEVLDCVKSLR